MQDFRKLQVWDRAMEITTRIYETTKAFPRCKQFGLTAQLRGASSSIGANIAEGCGRGSNKDFLRFLHMAIGSAFEVENHILLAESLKYLEKGQASSMVEDVIELKKMLSSLMRKVKRASNGNKKEGCQPS
ncbi:MAG: four helix bundle protein [bacterium]|nr:four helix bundle protein [bacterium]MDT8396722.1 four helix bundle protein [bacterium]